MDWVNFIFTDIPIALLLRPLQLQYKTYSCFLGNNGQFNSLLLHRLGTIKSPVCYKISPVVRSEWTIASFRYSRFFRRAFNRALGGLTSIIFTFTHICVVYSESMVIVQKIDLEILCFLWCPRSTESIKVIFTIRLIDGWVSVCMCVSVHGYRAKGSCDVSFWYSISQPGPKLHASETLNMWVFIYIRCFCSKSIFPCYGDFVWLRISYFLPFLQKLF